MLKKNSEWHLQKAALLVLADRTLWSPTRYLNSKAAFKQRNIKLKTILPNGS